MAQRWDVVASPCPRLLPRTCSYSLVATLFLVQSNETGAVNSLVDQLQQDLDLDEIFFSKILKSNFRLNFDFCFRSSMNIPLTHTLNRVQLTVNETVEEWGGCRCERLFGAIPEFTGQGSN